MPRAILANIFLVAYILFLFNSPKGSWSMLQNMKISENIIISHITTPCNNNYQSSEGSHGQNKKPERNNCWDDNNETNKECSM